MPKAAFYTLGCKVNQTDTAALQSLLEQAGYKIVPFHEQADVYIINTCTVTHLSDRKSRQMIRRARRQNREAVIAATGCYAQVSPEDVMNIPEVDLVVGTHARDKLPELLQQAKTQRLNCVAPLEEKHAFDALGTAALNEHTRAFLKVQEGCRQFCSYCIVPYARGPLYSRPLADAVRAAEKLVSEGFRELVLTGVHLGSYGVDLEEKISLNDLLRQLVKIDGLARIRISSLEPTEVSAELVELMRTNIKICNHLHIPLQSGDDYILQRMNRKYSTQEFLSLVQWLRSEIPDIALTTDVMVGFPGETEEHFQNTLQTVEKAAFSRLHVFKYSARHGTPAAKYPHQVSPQIKQQRSQRLIEVGEKLAARYGRQFLGQTVEVLFEETVGDKHITGLTEHYLRVKATGGDHLLGKILPVKITALADNVLAGEITE
ncbi:MAG: tRNA (N(6)-L-threonylcarbamoyladenosine(37)-C(2))-methylthiotransferase MtaB [Firmicutes bacterium]|nr:tRNA (N(6)-L-threonylcarbamoyladenosine(37)-C(2))-methylthiotransferase MtaB [Bacillota bacterium]